MEKNSTRGTVVSLPTPPRKPVSRRASRARDIHDSVKSAAELVAEARDRFADAFDELRTDDEGDALTDFAEGCLALHRLQLVFGGIEQMVAAEARLPPAQKGAQ